MARVYIRILAALFALAVLAGTVLGVYYVYRENYLPEQQRTAEVRELLGSTAPKADPGRKEFDRAMDFIRRGEMEAAKQLLTEITEVYQDSSRFGDSRRVLGEMNLDRLFSRTPMPGKLEYTIRRGDSLHEIAKKFRTTMAYIRRVNNLLGSVVHPDDRLIVYPLDFAMQVDLTEKRITLLKDGRFFKEYAVTGLHLPFPSLPEQTTLGDKPAWIDNKKISPTDERYTAARKWLQTTGRSGRPGIVFCAVPKAEPAAGEDTPAPAPRIPGPAAPSSRRGKKDKSAAAANAPLPPPAPPAGIYLSGEDIEELSTLVRVGTPVHFLKKAASTAAR